MLIIFLYSFSSFHWMTYKFYFFEYSIFLEFLRIYKYYSILSCQCWKWHLGSETVLSATLSPKLWLILVISDDFFFLQLEFVTSISERLLGIKCLTFSEIIHEFCLRLPNFFPSATYGYQSILSPLINSWNYSHLKLIRLHPCQRHALSHGFSVIDK